MNAAAFQDTLRCLDHRPWPPPARPWVMHMRWASLAFLHWPVPARVFEGRIPSPLRLETFDGSAWLGVVPFEMQESGLRWLPPIPVARRFAELNVRTYVTDGTKRGVWFLSLDAASPVAVAIARSWFHLPYFRARMECTAAAGEVRYVSNRTHGGAPPAALRARYAPCGDVFRGTPGSLEDFLTSRYCLYSADRSGRVLRGEIHHAPWPLQPARVLIEEDTMARAHGIDLPSLPPHALFVDSIDVVAWSPRPIHP